MTQLSDEQLDLIKSCIVQHPDYDPKKCRMSELVNLVWEKSSMFMNSIANENTVKKYIMKIVGENIEKCNVASDIAHIQEAQESFIKETVKEEPVEETIEFSEVEAPHLDATSIFYKLEQALEEVTQKPDTVEEPQLEIDIDELSFADAPVVELQELPIEEFKENPIKEPAQPINTVQSIPDVPQENAYEHVIDPLEGTKTKKVSKELTQKVVDIIRTAHKNDPSKQYFKIFYLKYVQKMKQSQIARELAITEEELCDRYLKLVRIVKNGLK